MISWPSALILLSIMYGVFVLIAVRGLFGVINDQLVARRMRAARAASPVAHHIQLPEFTPAVPAEA